MGTIPIISMKQLYIRFSFGNAVGDKIINSYGGPRHGQDLPAAIQMKTPRDSGRLFHSFSFRSLLRAFSQSSYADNDEQQTCQHRQHGGDVPSFGHTGLRKLFRLSL